MPVANDTTEGGAPSNRAAPIRPRPLPYYLSPEYYVASQASKKKDIKVITKRPANNEKTNLKTDKKDIKKDVKVITKKPANNNNNNIKKGIKVISKKPAVNKKKLNN